MVSFTSLAILLLMFTPFSRVPEPLKVAPEPVRAIQQVGALETLSAIRSIREWVAANTNRHYVITISDNYTEVYLFEYQNGRLLELRRTALVMEEAIKQALEDWK